MGYFRRLGPRAARDPFYLKPSFVVYCLEATDIAPQSSKWGRKRLIKGNWYEGELKLNFHPCHAGWPDRGAIAWSLIWWQDGSNPNLRLWIICPSFLCLRIIRPPHIAPLITQLHFEYSISALCLSLMLLLNWIWQFRNIQVQILATIIVHIFASGPHQFELSNFQTNTNPSRIFVCWPALDTDALA